MKLSIYDVESILASNVDGNNIKNILYVLLNSANDWPGDVLSLEEYLTLVEDFIKAKATKQNLENALKEIDLKIGAWQSESISQLLEIYSYL
jgi:hypothetical protein